MKSLCLLLVIFSFCNSCGGIYKPGSVKTFDPKQNLVLTHSGGAFRIGVLPGYWQEKDSKLRAVIFQNQRNQSTISVSSWCKDAFTDTTLQYLTQELLYGLTDVKTQESKIIKMNGYDVQKNVSTGNMDGQPVYLRTYVMRLYECTFDFAYVDKPNSTTPQYIKDFDNLVLGFQYLKGPGLL